MEGKEGPPIPEEADSFPSDRPGRMELPPGPEGPIEEVEPGDSNLLEQVRKDLDQQTAAAPRTSLPITAEVSNNMGFKEQPARALRNLLIYPSFPQLLAMSTGVIAEQAASIALLGTSPLLGAIVAGNIIFLASEFIGFLRRTKRLSNFLTVRKVRPLKERVLADGTKITLDNNIGALHLSMLGLLGLASERRKARRALVIGKGMMEGLISLAEKIENNDPYFGDFTAFEGISSIVNPRLASRLGFEVTKPTGLRSRLYPYIFGFDNFITASPSGTNDVYQVWISREGVTSHKNDFLRELRIIQLALEKRN